MNFNHPQPVGPASPIILFGALALFLILVALKARGDDGESGGNRSRLSVLGIIVQMLAFGLVGFGNVHVALPLTSSRALEQAGMVIALCGFTCWLFAASKRALGRNWSIVARTRSEHELVTWGPFAYLRHPIYSALFAWLAAMAVALGHYRGLILAVPLYWIGTILRIREEERLLRDRFGAAYDAYAARVKRFLPGIV
jgi:protein-S-isoprenylcysteine O-methyltransferase Ste14